jgi:hypothetical protein
MSPEQIRGEPQSPKTDIFGVGVLLYEMLYGAVPHRTDSLPELMHRRLHEPVTFPVDPPISDELRNLIAACLERDASRRPGTVTGQLRSVRRRNFAPPAPAAIAVATPHPGSQGEPPLARSSAAPRVGRLSRRSPDRNWIAVFAGAAMVVVFATAVVTIFGDSPRFAQFAIGLGLVGCGAGASLAVLHWLRRRRATLGDEAAQILTGSRTRAALTQSLAIQVDHLMLRCRTVDERFLGASIALMIDEFQQAKAFDDRQRALVASVEFLEKLTSRLSPWYVRYEKLIAAVVALLGIVPGVYQMLQTLW